MVHKWARILIIIEEVANNSVLNHNSSKISNSKPQLDSVWKFANKRLISRDRIIDLQVAEVIR